MKNLLFVIGVIWSIPNTSFGPLPWLNFDKVNAIFVQNGKIKSCLDKEFKSIENEVIDGASEQINEDYDKMLELKG